MLNANFGKNVRDGTFFSFVTTQKTPEREIIRKVISSI
jgi:hypothetical protein